MVYFQCEKCISTLKKKQVEHHYTHECRDATSFICISCHQKFNRETIKAHTSCISEDEKYKKGDKMVKKQNNFNKEKKLFLAIYKLLNGVDWEKLVK